MVFFGDVPKRLLCVAFIVGRLSGDLNILSPTSVGFAICISNFLSPTVVGCVVVVFSPTVVGFAVVVFFQPFNITLGVLDFLLSVFPHLRRMLNADTTTFLLSVFPHLSRMLNADTTTFSSEIFFFYY